MTAITAIICFFILLVLTILAFHYTARHIYDYQIKEQSICVLLFRRIPLINIPINDISEIQKLLYKEVFLRKGTLMALSLGNRMWGDVILIRKKNGIVRTILITPDNADWFIQQVKSHF